MEGWIKLHRCLIEKAIWKKSLPEQKAILITILCLANHNQNEWIWHGEKFNTKPGQFITSLEKLAEKSGTSIKSVRTALKNFEKLEFLANESAKTGRLITVINWALYQQEEKKSAKPSADEGQTGGKEVATNKNDMNDKTDKKNILWIEILSYLNEKAGTAFRNVDTHKTKIMARVNEGYTLDAFKTVIDKKCDEWKGTDKAQYLRPETLFGNKFDGYLNQLSNRPQSFKDFL